MSGASVILAAFYITYLSASAIGLWTIVLSLRR